MALHLKFIGHASIDNVNLRTQGEEDSRVLATDIKLSGNVSANALNDLLGASEGDDLSSIFWNPEDDREDADLLTHAINSIALDVKWDNCTLSLGRHKVRADIKKPSFRPRGGRILDLAISATIEDPNEDLIDYLAHRIKEAVVCEIHSQPELFDGKNQVENK